MRCRHSALLIALTLLALPGCGEESQTQSGASLLPIRGPEPPPGASPLLRALYRNFQPPLADPGVRGSAKAIKAGIRACEGQTPVEVKRRFIGDSELSASQRQALAQLRQAEANPTAEFVAGQLAALVYEGTLEKGQLPEYGYRGCIYGLAKGLKGELG